jgi:hypothetical protein
VNLGLGMRILLIESGGRFPGQPEEKVRP